MYATDKASKIKSHPVTDLIAWGVNRAVSKSGKKE